MNQERKALALRLLHQVGNDCEGAPAFVRPQLARVHGLLLLLVDEVFCQDGEGGSNGPTAGAP